MPEPDSEGRENQERGSTGVQVPATQRWFWRHKLWADRSESRSGYALEFHQQFFRRLKADVPVFFEALRYDGAKCQRKSGIESSNRLWLQMQNVADCVPGALTFE